LKGVLKLEKEIFSVEETAKILDMHPKTIRRYVKNGILKANKLGGQWKIKKLDLEKLMDTS
jgi:excisionase family DNA binding protein